MPTITKYPTSDTAVSGTWTNPTNVQSDNGAVAVVTIAAKNTTFDREQGNYGFDTDIPAGSTINSVAIEVEHRVSGTGGIAFLENLGYINTTAGAVNSDSAEPTTLTARTYSNYARPGGGSWTRADLLNGTFKTRTRARSGNNATSVNYEWDYIRVTVDYSLPPRIAQVSQAELEVPTANRAARVSFAELEAPQPPRIAHVSFAALEVPDAPRAAHISFAELETPTANRGAQVSFAEFETPDVTPSTDRQLHVSFAEFEAPTANRIAAVSVAEFEVPDAPPRALVSFAELEIPNAPRGAQISFAVLEVPGVGEVLSRCMTVYSQQ